MCAGSSRMSGWHLQHGLNDGGAHVLPGAGVQLPPDPPGVGFCQLGAVPAAQAHATISCNLGRYTCSICRPPAEQEDVRLEVWRWLCCSRSPAMARWLCRAVLRKAACCWGGSGV